MNNGERADRLLREARQIAGEMKRALDDEAWNLAIRGPVFYQETVVTDAQARDWAQRVERALLFGEDLLRWLRAAR